ncbi:hypothetical protein ACFL3I_02145 [Pseudomonadota bacterium]
MKYYVYALLDPRNSEIFYIGKGKGNRLTAHVKEAGDATNNSPKHKRIRQIEATGQALRQIYLAKDIAQEGEAFAIEAMLIYEAKCHNIVFGIKTNLTNLASGHHTERYRPWGRAENVSGFEYAASKAGYMAFHEHCIPLFNYVIKKIPEFKNSVIGTQPYIRGHKRTENSDFHYVLWPKGGYGVTFEYLSLAGKKEAQEVAKRHASKLRDMLSLDCNYSHAKIDSVRPDLDVNDYPSVAAALQEFIDIVDQAELDILSSRSS